MRLKEDESEPGLGTRPGVGVSESVSWAVSVGHLVSRMNRFTRERYRDVASLQPTAGREPAEARVSAGGAMGSIVGGGYASAKYPEHLTRVNQLRTSFLREQWR